MSKVYKKGDTIIIPEWQRNETQDGFIGVVTSMSNNDTVVHWTCRTSAEFDGIGTGIIHSGSNVEWLEETPTDVTDRLKIGEKVNNPINSYKFAFEWFHGDGDDYSSSEVIIPKDSKYLSKFIEFVDKLDDIAGKDIHEVRKNRDLKIDIDRFESGKWDNDKMGFQFEVEEDSTSDHNYYAKQDGLVVTFFDETGIEHEVKFTK